MAKYGYTDNKETEYFDKLIEQYINGTTDWIETEFMEMNVGKKDRFLDYVYSQIDHERAYSIFYSILKRIQ